MLFDEADAKAKGTKAKAKKQLSEEELKKEEEGEHRLFTKH